MPDGADGFTLVETLVVIVIISVLAGLLLPALSRARDKSRETQTINNLRQIMMAVAMFSEDYDCLPEGSGDISILRGQLEKYISADSQVYRDGWKKELIYVESSSYPFSMQAIAGPPITGYYNPGTYQLYSCGRNKKCSAAGKDEVNSDNLWVDTKGACVVRFAAVREQPGQ